MSITIDGKPLKLAFLPKQEEIFYNMPDEVQFTVATKGRRFGATEGGALFSLDCVFSDRKILWVDVTQTNLTKYVDGMFLPVLNKIQKKYWHYDKQRHKIKFNNGLIDFRSAEKPQSIEGFAYDIIILNEAGIILKGLRGRNMWQESISPMILDYQAKVFFLGVPKGKRPKKDEKALGYTKSLYYELYLRAIDNNNPKWRGLNYSSYDNPLLSPEDIKELEKEVPKHIVDQEIYGKFVDIDGVSVFDRNWFTIVDKLPPIEEWRGLYMSADTAFETKKSADDSAICLGIDANNGYYILDLFVGKVDIIDLVKAVNDMFQNYNYRWKKRIKNVLIEKKASGHSLLQVFKRKTKVPVQEVIPKDDKYVRACATVPIFQTGHFFLLRGKWNDQLIDQMTEFNALMDTPDDIVDCVTQFINYCEEKPTINYDLL
jgi:predicted phage terminase large subunit-like protein